MSISAPDGTIFAENGLIFVQKYQDEEEASRYHIRNIRSGSKYKSIVSWKNETLDDIALFIPFIYNRSTLRSLKDVHRNISFV